MKHAARRAERQPRRHARLAAGVAALLGAVVVLMGGQGTFAFWTDQASVTGGSFVAGKLDLTVDGQQGASAPHVKADLAMGSMLPGESVARVITVANVGDAPLTWVPQVTKGGGLGPALTVEMTVGPSTSVTNSTTYPRVGTCSGGTVMNAGATSGRLSRGESRQLCVRVALPADTGNGFQGASGGSVTISLNASQVLP
ncbi:TasA family protein [Nocardioides sp. SYSU DS0663]|uniref:TasA family protein n=1 Tax=Nocardioides sp. SYSU DS0663 TaxID=3416445 RepID=UPI003F4B4AEF